MKKIKIYFYLDCILQNMWKLKNSWFCDIEVWVQIKVSLSRPPPEPLFDSLLEILVIASLHNN